MVHLSVNINKIALLRNARGGDRPNLMTFASLALDAGAAGITIHPRPDQRHITADDARRLSVFMKDKPHEFNIEGNPFEGVMGSFPGFMALVEDTLPDQCTLVPDTIHQKTSDHGWDFEKESVRLTPVLDVLKQYGIRVSVFVDPTEKAVEGAAKLGADRIEFYTEDYAKAYAMGEGERCFLHYSKLAVLAHELGLGINAGHDLNLENVSLFATLPYLKEVSIGQALVSDALEMGFELAVKSYLKRL